MLDLSVLFAIGAISVALLINLWRLLRGPDVPDRVLALDALYVNVLALLLAVGISYGLELSFTGALLIALMGVVSTVALAKYLARGDIID